MFLKPGFRHIEKKNIFKFYNQIIIKMYTGKIMLSGLLLVFLSLTSCDNNNKPNANNTTTVNTYQTYKDNNVSSNNLRKNIWENVSYKTYINDRFGYRIDYPSLLKVSKKADNNDGCSFSYGGLTITVFGIYNTLFRSVNEQYQEDQKPTDTYKVIRNDWFVRSGVDDKGYIYYQKSMLKNDIWYTVILEYPKSMKEDLEKVVNRVILSFKVLSNSTSTGKSSSNNPNADVERYFAKFCGKSGSSLNNLFLQHQPTLLDCKVVFKDNFYQKAYTDFNELFGQLASSNSLMNDKGLKNRHYVRAEKFSTNDISEYGTGRMLEIKRHFKPGITCYSIQFLTNENDEYGTNYIFFTKINNRWVFFPFN